jgi:predicted AlkP superfamily phosphohydrolase/phosphomutase
MKLLLLGVDGCAMSMVDKLGLFKYLPFHQEIMTTIPPLTFPAVPAIYTGKNPADLGLDQWIKPDGNPVSFNDITESTIWDVLASRGFRCSVLNVPVTFPVRPVRNGRIAAGYPAPRVNTCPDFEWFTDPVHDIFNKPRMKDKEIFREQLGITKQRLDCIDLTYDFNFVWIKEPDTLGHYLWGTPWLDEYYLFLSAELEETIEGFDEVILLSDHGFAQKPDKEFHVNTWLQKKGYIKNSKNIKLMLKMARLPQHLKQVLLETRVRPREIFSGEEIYADSETGIWCPSERVDEVIGDLQKEPCIKKVWRREEVYHGRYLDLFPPVVFVPKEDYMPDITLAESAVTPHNSDFRGDHHSSFEAVLLTQNDYGGVSNVEQIKDLVIRRFEQASG